jgi:hypothetical protein
MAGDLRSFSRHGDSGGPSCLVEGNRRRKMIIRTMYEESQNRCGQKGLSKVWLELAAKEGKAEATE